jgi:hypothetical protein
MSRRAYNRRIYLLIERIWGWHIKQTVWETNAKCVADALGGARLGVQNAQIELECYNSPTKEYEAYLMAVEKALKKIEKRLVGKIKADPEHHLCAMCGYIERQKKAGK